MSLLDEMAVHFGMGQGDIERFARTAPARYRVYEIDKRDGGKREIAQPTAALKKFQRYILENRLSMFPVHNAAAAYVRGRGIVDNAKMHRNSKCILKLDFERFFPSITVRDWRVLVRRSGATISTPESHLLERFLFWGGGSSFSPQILSIGAPTSPLLSNAVMYEFDVAVTKLTADRGLSYSRYADDITISGEMVSDLIWAEARLKAIISKMKSPNLRFNDDKRGVYTSGQRRMITGLVLTPGKQVSIGRDRKRTISVMLHHAACGKLDVNQIAHLKGLLGFCVAVESDFVGRMRKKYGSDIVDRVMKSESPKRI